MENKEDYLSALLGKNTITRFFIPNSKIEIEYRLLSTNEMFEIKQKAKAFLTSRKLDKDDSAYEIETACQSVYLAAYEPETENKFFKSVADVRLISSEMLSYLSEQFTVFSLKNNPTLDDLSEDKLEELKKKLMSGGSLNGLNYFQLQSLCNHLAESLAVLEPPVKSSLDARLEK